MTLTLTNLRLRPSPGPGWESIGDHSRTIAKKPEISLPFHLTTCGDILPFMMRMRALAGISVCVACACGHAQNFSAPQMKEIALHEYAGTYQWSPHEFLDLQLWSELSGKNQLVAFNGSGEVRTLYPQKDDRFVTGPAAAIPAPIESQVEFERNASGKIISLRWQQNGSAPRVARRIDTEKRQEVRFENDGVHLAGMLICPATTGRHPAVILVPGSGEEDREYLLPLAHFLVRSGVAVLGYDKRGVGQSTGSWRSESFDDLASDAIAAFQFLKTRPEIDHSQIGMLGLSQAGWVMPLAAIRTKGFAFLISISGAAIPPGETVVDEARGEMAAAGMKPGMIEQITGLMRLQFAFAQTGQGWDDYAAARAKIVARIGNAPDTFPDSPTAPYWQTIRALYFYDPAPTLRRLVIPVLAVFGELDDNILAEKNSEAWDGALKAAGNPHYALRILPKANHLMLEAKVGSNTEMPSLKRFVPTYFTTLQDWLANTISGFKPNN
jgi:pimeloyl-ACP methyl ester carboxylesterase